MRYSSFHIRNFKGIADARIDFDREPEINIFTLVGLNESGKTTVLEAINFFSQENFPSAHMHIPKSKKHNFNEAISIAATLHLSDEDEIELANYLRDNRELEVKEPLRSMTIEKRHAFENSIARDTTSIWQGQLTVATKKKAKEKIIDLRSEEAVDIRSFLARRLPVIVYYPNFLFDIPEKIYLQDAPPSAETPAPAKSRVKEERTHNFFQRVIEDILDYMDEKLSIQTHIIDRFKARDKSVADKEALEAQLLKMSSKMNRVIFAAWKEIFPNSRPKQIDLDIAADPDGRSYFELTIKEGSNKFKIGERSLGFRWFFTFLLVTEFRKVRSEDPGETIFLLDEPAYNLHSTAQKILLKIFAQLADKSKLIYTTHSHYLIEPTWLGGAYIIRNLAMDYENEVDFEESNTNIAVVPYRQFVAQHPDQSTYFQPILDALDYQPSKLEIVPALTIFEGKFDYYAMRYINEIILDGKFKVHPYPGSGDNLLPVIRLYLSWGARFIVVLDGDKAGQRAKQRYEKELGKIAQTLIFTLGDIKSEWAGATESLFTETEKAQIVAKANGPEGPVTKSALFTSIEALLIAKTKVKLTKGTLSNFEAIFAFIHEKIKS